MPPYPPVVRALGTHLGHYMPKLSLSASLSSTSKFFEKENPAQCEVQCFFFPNTETVYGVLSISTRNKKRNISESTSNRMNNHWFEYQVKLFKLLLST